MEKHKVKQDSRAFQLVRSIFSHRLLKRKYHRESHNLPEGYYYARQLNSVMFVAIQFNWVYHKI